MAGSIRDAEKHVFAGRRLSVALRDRIERKLKWYEDKVERMWKVLEADDSLRKSVKKVA